MGKSIIGRKFFLYPAIIRTQQFFRSNPIVTLLSSFSMLVGLGSMPLMAMELGAGQKKEASDLLTNCFRFLPGLALFRSLVRKGLFVSGILLFPLLFTAPAAFAAEPFCDIVASCLSGALFLRFTPRLLDARCGVKDVFSI